MVLRLHKLAMGRALCAEPMRASCVPGCQLWPGGPRDQDRRVQLGYPFLNTCQRRLKTMPEHYLSKCTCACLCKISTKNPQKIHKKSTKKSPKIHKNLQKKKKKKKTQKKNHPKKPPKKKKKKKKKIHNLQISGM